MRTAKRSRTRVVTWPLAIVVLFAQAVVLGTPAARGQTEDLSLTGAGVAGDFNGDGRDDVANFDAASGSWLVGLSDGARFDVTRWGAYPQGTGWTHRVGDFTADGRADIFSFRDGSGRNLVAISTGSSFTVESWLEPPSTSGWQTFLPGDFDGDTDADIAGYNTNSETWFVFTSTRFDFDDGRPWTKPARDLTWNHLTGDFNGDQKIDIASFGTRAATWWVGLSDGTRFVRTKWADLTPDHGWSMRRSGDFNGDGRADIANFFTGARWRLSRSTSNDSFATSTWVDLSPNTGWGAAVPGDFNGDGRDDLATFHRSEVRWVVSIHDARGSGSDSAPWATLSKPRGWQSHSPGDFDGDGLTDIASFHSPTGHWWVARSATTRFIPADWNPGNQRPEARFTHECSGLTCSFQDRSVDGDGTIQERTWDFGDGTTSSEFNPTHSYAAGGVYEVVLTVTDNEGASDRSTKDVSVRESNTAPTARFSVDCDNRRCSFTDRSIDDGSIQSYNWDFGDGSKGTGRTIVHTYGAGGTYTVTHRVTDAEGLSGTTRRPIDVLIRHERRVVMELDHIQGYLYVRGRVRVADSFRICRAGRDVIVQKRSGGKWVHRVTGRSNARGRYLIPLYYFATPHDRPGTYRVVVPRERPATKPSHICLSDASPPRTHRH